MSAQSVARWNAIPMERPELSETDSSSSLKRSREDEASDDDDDITIASRTPSPPPEGMDIDKYDEYVPGHIEREVITVETKIKPSNIGFSMLTKMGWSEGQPVGLSGEGRVDPVPFTLKADNTGLGKITRDVEMIETTVAQRRDMDSERYAKQTKEQKRVIEEDAARKAALQSSIYDTLRAFYCELCDKQFKNVAQYDEHTNSYAHAHKAREKDMKASFKIGTALGADERREKERAREEKELRKLAKAQGIKLVKPVQPAHTSGVVNPAPAVAAPANAPEPPPPAPQANKGGWAAVAQPPPPPAQAPTSFIAPQSSFTSGGFSSKGFERALVHVPAETPANAVPHSSSALPAAASGASTPTTGTSAPSQAVQPPLPSDAGPSDGPVLPEAGVQGTTPPVLAPVVPSPVPRAQRPPPEPKQDRETKRSGWQNFRAGKAGRR